MKHNLHFSQKCSQISRVKSESLISYYARSLSLRGESVADGEISKYWCKDRSQWIGFSSLSMLLCVLAPYKSFNWLLGFSPLCGVQMPKPWLSLGWQPGSSQLPKPAVLVISHRCTSLYNSLKTASLYAKDWHRQCPAQVEQTADLCLSVLIACKWAQLSWSRSLANMWQKRMRS